MAKKEKREKRKKGLKWRIIEDITAHAHRSPGVLVRKNVRLSPLRMSPKRKRYREIDVLLSSQVAGHLVHFAIECKDHSRPISSPEIDSFIGKLQDVGIPPQMSVFVSTSGYYESAVERATEVGMKTLIITETDLHLVPIRISTALQTVVFMICFYRGFSFETQEPAQRDESIQHLTFFDRSGHMHATAADLIWWGWMQGHPPLQCGMYEYNLSVPSEWMFHADGSPNTACNFKVKLEVRAFVMQLQGSIGTHQFQDARTGIIDRNFIKVEFDQQIPSNISLFKTETELLTALKTPADIKLNVGRIRLPKIVMDNQLTWPISDAAWNYFKSLKKTNLTPAELQRIAEINWESFWNPLPSTI